MKRRRKNLPSALIPIFHQRFVSEGKCNKTRAVTVCDLTLSQTTNFRPFQTESVCRRQFQL